jgi:hypothetical protein
MCKQNNRNQMLVICFIYFTLVSVNMHSNQAGYKQHKQRNNHHYLSSNS